MFAPFARLILAFLGVRTESPSSPPVTQPPAPVPADDLGEPDPSLSDTMGTSAAASSAHHLLTSAWDAPHNRPGEHADWRIHTARIHFPVDPAAAPALSALIGSIDPAVDSFGLTLDDKASPLGPSVVFWRSGASQDAVTLAVAPPELMEHLPDERSRSGLSLRRVQSGDGPGALEVIVDLLEPRSAPKPCADAILAALQRDDDGPGAHDGVHYGRYVDLVKALKREARYEEAAALLASLADAVEREVDATGHTPSPWVFRDLGICLRRLKRTKEAAAADARYPALLKRSATRKA